MSQLSIEIHTTRTPLVLKAAELLRREVGERTGLSIPEAPSAALVLDIRPGIGTEGFTIEDGPGRSVAIVGADERGLIYGVGKFLRTSRFDDGDFTPSQWRGTSVPKRRVRGIYFASHFFNFYHAAPLDKVERYVEELALWGCNVLAVWFDMHHYHGMEDPDAQQMIERLRAVLKAANGVGISGALTTIANEGYASSPEALRADWTAGHDGYTTPPGGHYHCEVCPSVDGGLQYILSTRRHMLEAFADLDIRYVWLWPYDQGGCTCARCAPWGSGGFLKCAIHLAPLIREMLPNARVILSTWYFDKFTTGEWAGLAESMGNEKPEYADYILADDYGDNFPSFPLEHGVPGGLPLLNFPEISMYNMWPWGGYGANPLPAHLQRIWDSCGQHVSGGFPYSEGIFEDLNKAISLQHYWDDRPATDTVREYLAWIAGPDAVDDLSAAVQIMEEQHTRGNRPFGDFTEESRELIFPPDGGGSEMPLFIAPSWPRADECLRLVEKAEAKMSAPDREAWRWRLLRLRAQIDADMQRTGGHNDAVSDALFAAVEAISCVQTGEYCVSTPSRRMFVRCFIDNKPGPM